MKLHKHALASAAIWLAMSQPAAASAMCQGTVAASYVNTSGSVVISGSWRGDYTQICNITTAWYNVTPEVCATWLAKVDAAVSLGRTVIIYYSDPTNDCSTLPTYGSTPPPYYVMLQ